MRARSGRFLSEVVCEELSLGFTGTGDALNGTPEYRYGLPLQYTSTKGIPVFGAPVRKISFSRFPTSLKHRRKNTGAKK